MRREVFAYIGLGSNLHDPRAQVERAFSELSALPSSRLSARSSLYRARPLGPSDQPDYVNAVAELRTLLAPVDLLRGLQQIEVAHGRVRGPERWGPRTLDLDLLLYGQRTIQLPELTVPHAGLAQRAFVLLPLLELAGPALQIPGRGRLGDLAAASDSLGVAVL